MENILGPLRAELRRHADAGVRESGQRYFREPVELYGVKTATVSDIARRTFRKLGKIPKEEVFGLCEELWKSGMMEEGFVACKWVYEVRSHYQPGDFQIFEQWVAGYVTNWAACDSFCNHPVGSFTMMYPVFLDNLKGWTGSPNRWMRRASAVSLIVPARKGMFLPEIFDMATLLLTDRDDMVQKGYGWMLKSASQAHQQAVFDFVLGHRKEMPRTALRYAIEKMPEEMKRKAMAKG